jgi:hypothetical protein
MNHSDFEAMAIEHFGLTLAAGSIQQATTATLTNLAAFAAKAYELGLKDGSYDQRRRLAGLVRPSYSVPVTRPHIHTQECIERGDHS